MPLHTLRADIDYGFHEAKTTFARLRSRSGFTRATFPARVPSALLRRRAA